MPKSRADNSGNEGGAAKKPRQTITTWEEQSVDERKTHLQTLSAKLKELGLTHISLRDQSSVTVQPEAASELSRKHSLVIDGLFAPTHEEKYREFVKFAETVLTDADDVATKGPCVGDSAVPTKAFSVARKAEVPVTFGGQVVLLVFWAPNEIRTIQHIRKIAEEHKDWVNKARIVCISVADPEDQEEDLSDMPLVTHLCSGDGASDAWGASQHGLEYILVDSKGVIAKRADLEGFNVSKDIATCIAGQKLQEEEEKLSEGQWAGFSDEARTALLTRFGQAIKDAALLVGLHSDNVTTYNSEGQKGPEEARLILDGVVSHSQEPALTKIINDLHAAKVLDVEYEFTTMFKLPTLDDEGDDEGDENPTPVLPANCHECQSPLATAKARYLCACCPAPYYAVCDKCEVNRAASPTHAAHHVFFVVPATGWSDDVHFSVGDFTTWPVFADTISAREQEVFCDGCKQNVGHGVRFECVQCDDHDLCAQCWQNQKPEDAHSGHIWLKIHEPRGCKPSVGPEGGGMDMFDGGDEGDFGGEDDEQDPNDTRIQLQ